MENNRLDEFKKLPTIQRKTLVNPALPTVNSLKLQANIDIKTNSCLTKRQKQIVDLVSAEIMDYVITRAKQVKPEEWLGLLKSVTFLVVAAVKKDNAMLLIHLQSIGAFFLKHFLPDFEYNSKMFTLSKDGDKVGFNIK